VTFNSTNSAGIEQIWCDVMLGEIVVFRFSRPNPGGTPIPDTPLPPGYKNLQAEATTCRPRQHPLLGALFVAVKDRVESLGAVLLAGNTLRYGN
jgi:hypothetical protein